MHMMDLSAVLIVFLLSWVAPTKAEEEEDTRRTRSADWMPKRLPSNVGKLHICHQTLSGDGPQEGRLYDFVFSTTT